MIALSIRQPWAWLIVHGYKDIENRTWATKFRGRFLVHASQGMSRSEYLEALSFVAQETTGLRLSFPTFDELATQRGGIVGEAEIVGCTKDSSSAWFCGPYGFEIRNAKPRAFVPCKGRLGFFQIGGVQ